MLRANRRRPRGFTLLEVLIAISIMAIDNKYFFIMIF